MRIKDYEDYDVDKNGLVISMKFDKEKILKQYKGRDGYMFVRLSKNGIKKNFKIHHLVWDQFGTSERDGRKKQVDHIDENKLNNHIDNLQLLSQRENVSKGKFKYGKSSKYTGVSWNKQAKKWVAQTFINNKKKFLGYFDNELEAHNKYEKFYSGTR